jgi:predicted acyltransferase
MAQKIFSFSSVNKFFFSGIVSHVPEAWGAVVYAVGYVAICWLFLYFLYKKNTFLKI